MKNSLKPLAWVSLGILGPAFGASIAYLAWIEFPVLLIKLFWLLYTLPLMQVAAGILFIFLVLFTANRLNRS